jgi:carboxypeptidase C (cathepsin A)
MSDKETRPRPRLAALASALLLSACAVSPPATFSGHAFRTDHSGTFGGVELNYVAAVEETVLTDEQGRETASMFATSYVRQDVADYGSRPVIFIWNGGPAAASQTLHIAGFGPRRLVVPPDPGAPVAAPYETTHNRHTVLDVADLVFVDPVETGYSRMLPAGDPSYFFSAEGDAEAAAQFIRQWLSNHDRQTSPRFVLGTSYASIRAALVARILTDSPMPLDGAMLFSQGLNLVETTQRRNNVVGYACNMPQIAAIAWYHGRTSMQDRPVAEVIDEMYDFAMGDYLAALAKGRLLPAGNRPAIADRLAGMTGISAEYYLEHDLRINKPTFRRELLKEQGLVLGAADARYVAAADGETGPANPTQGVAEAFRQHLTEFLGVTLPADEYRGFALDIAMNWDYEGWTTLGGGKVPRGSKRSIFADFDYPGEIRHAFDADPDFRVMIATGIYDTLTTVGPARMLAATPGYPADRIVMLEYAGGHAFYSNDAEFERLANDVRLFVTE